MSLRLLLIAFFAPAMATGSASAASLLNSWNIITTGDLNATANTETEGTVRVGGKLTATSQYRAAIHVPVVDNTNNLIVGGNASSTGGLTVQHGSAQVGGSVKGPTSGSFTANVTAVQGIGAADSILLQGYSSAFEAINANNTVSLPTSGNSGVTFTVGHVNSDNVAVFDVSGASLFNNGHIQQIDLGFANGLGQGSVSSIVINVSGTGPFEWGKTGNFVGNFAGDWARTHVLWNFYQATSITFDQKSFNGSALAPFAAVTTDSNSFQGSIFAASLSQGGEVHQYLYDGFVPNVSPVPEPSSLAMLGLASACGLGCRLRKRRAA